MRYDIYKMLTQGIPSYSQNDLERKILLSMIPSSLGRQVESLTTNRINFKIKDKSDKMEMIAEKDTTSEDYKDAIFISTSLKEDRIVSSAEIIGHDKNATDTSYSYKNNLYYSCLEIIDNGQNILLVGGTVIYPESSTKKVTAKLGKWIYDRDLIEIYKPLNDICKSYIYKIDICEELTSLKEHLHDERFIIPENYVMIEQTIENSKISRIVIDNDGEDYNLSEEKYEEMSKIMQECNLENPRLILRNLNENSDFIYLSDFSFEQYNRFNSLEFINLILERNNLEVEENKAKQLKKTTSN